MGHRAERLDLYRALAQRDFPLGRAAAIQPMILQKGLRYEEGNLRWCEEMLALLDMPLSASTAAPPAT